MLDFAFSFNTSLLHDETPLIYLLLELSLLLVVGLDKTKQVPLLMTLHISHQKLILVLKIVQLVSKARDLRLEQVLPFDGAFLQDFIFSLQLHILTSLLVLSKF